MNIDDDIHVEKNQNGVETYVFDPYNPLNKLINKEQVEDILRRYGINYSIHNLPINVNLVPLSSLISSSINTSALSGNCNLNSPI